MDAFVFATALFVIGVVAGTGALVRRRVMADARRGLWKQSAIGLGLVARKSAFPGLSMGEDAYDGMIDDTEVSVARAELGDGRHVLRVTATVSPALRLGLYASTVPDTRDDRLRPPTLTGHDVLLPYAAAHDAERARQLLAALSKRIADARVGSDLTLTDDSVVVSSDRVGNELELRADVKTVLGLCRAMRKAANDLGEGSIDAALRASWTELAERRGLVVEPGPILRGTLRRLSLVAEIQYHPFGATRSTRIVLACPMPSERRVHVGPKMGALAQEALEALFGRGFGRKRTKARAPAGEDAITSQLRELVGDDDAEAEVGPFADRFEVIEGVPSEAVRRALLRLDPRVTQVVTEDEGVRFGASEALDADDLDRVVGEAEEVAYALMGETPKDATYRKG